MHENGTQVKERKIEIVVVEYTRIWFYWKERTHDQNLSFLLKDILYCHRICVCHSLSDVVVFGNDMTTVRYYTLPASLLMHSKVLFFMDWNFMPHGKLENLNLL